MLSPRCVRDRLSGAARAPFRTPLTFFLRMPSIATANDLSPAAAVSRERDAPAVPLLTIDRLHKRFDDKVILRSVSLEVGHGETVVLIGPSGSGKTTLLRCINFLETPDGGTIRLGAPRIGVSERRPPPPGAGPAPARPRLV